MKSSNLRRFRILFSAIILVCFILIFADLKDIFPSAWINDLLWLQFVPSLIKFIEVGTIAAGGFIVIILLTLLTGRTYCSFLCPLGIGQDLFSRIGGKIKKRFRRFGYKKPFTFIRYTILVSTAAVTIFWGIYLLTLLDPFSIFGRFMTFFGKPAIILLNNFAAGVLHKFDFYTLDKVGLKGFDPLTYILPSLFLILTGILSLTRGRLFCNMICPVGTLLGIASRVSLLRIKVDNSKCTRCGRCSVSCKSSCIDSLQHKVDLTRCVGCFNCVHTCQEKAISYGLVRFKKEEQKTDTGKRNFIVGSLLFLFGIRRYAGAQDKKAPVPKSASTVKENRTTPVAPPGARSLEQFNKDCTGCSLCISACPNGVLQPAFIQYGLVGLMQPLMDYHRSFCTYNCTKCTEICPTYALQPLSLDAKKLTQIGKVNFIKDNCIVKTEKTACGACSEACPTKAVFMVQYEGTLLIPEVNTEICIGCGHCEYACPTSPYKAIYVDGNSVHQAASPPVNVKADIETPSDFPF